MAEEEIKNNVTEAIEAAENTEKAPKTKVAKGK